MEKVINFLLKNGFTEDSSNMFINDKCKVGIYEGNSCYSIDFYCVELEEEVTVYSNDLQFYWLYGFLTYNKLI